MVEIELAGTTLRLLPEGCAFVPVARALLVADAHLGKAHSFRRLGVPVPEGPTDDTLARLSAAVQATGREPGELVFDGLRIDPVRRAVLREGEAVELTGTEFELLLLLAREPGKVHSRDDILNYLRGHEAELLTRAVDIVISRLRKKLEPLDCIKTLRNAGYALALRRAT